MPDLDELTQRRDRIKAAIETLMALSTRDAHFVIAFGEIAKYDWKNERVLFENNPALAAELLAMEEKR